MRLQSALSTTTQNSIDVGLSLVAIAGVWFFLGRPVAQSMERDSQQESDRGDLVTKIGADVKTRGQESLSDIFVVNVAHTRTLYVKNGFTDELEIKSPFTDALDTTLAQQGLTHCRDAAHNDVPPSAFQSIVASNPKAAVVQFRIVDQEGEAPGMKLQSADAYKGATTYGTMTYSTRCPG